MQVTSSLYINREACKCNLKPESCRTLVLEDAEKVTASVLSVDQASIGHWNLSMFGKLAAPIPSDPAAARYSEIPPSTARYKHFTLNFNTVLERERLAKAFNAARAKHCELLEDEALRDCEFARLADNTVIPSRRPLSVKSRYGSDVTVTGPSRRPPYIRSISPVSEINGPWSSPQRR